MAKASSREDSFFGDQFVAEKPKRGRQEDGTWITSTGEVLPAKNRNRRVPYPEPEAKAVEGNREVVETPDGSLSFECVRIGDREYRAANYPSRKRLELRYRLAEVYAGKPRLYYSYDELEQLRKGAIAR